MHAPRGVKPIQDLRLAFVLLSRLPLPQLPDAAFKDSARSVWAYPIVGAVLGVLVTSIGWCLAILGVPVSLAAGVTLGVLIIVSGAMHEDGLADTADGFWGGHDPTRRLEIMKDSQIGTYGVLALGVVTGMRWLAYTGLLVTAPLVVIGCAALSRGAMPVVMAVLPHARDNGLSRSVGRVSLSGAALSVALSTMIAIPLIGATALALASLGLIVAALVSALAQRKIGGQTGDVLGATQQLAETLMLCAALLILA